MGSPDIFEERQKQYRAIVRRDAKLEHDEERLEEELIPRSKEMGQAEKLAKQEFMLERINRRRKNYETELGMLERHF